jgi:hypothetical protein
MWNKKLETVQRGCLIVQDHIENEHAHLEPVRYTWWANYQGTRECRN